MRSTLSSLLCLTALAFAVEGVSQTAPLPPPPASATPVPANPALTARVRGVDDEQHLRPLSLADLRIETHVVGELARTTLQAKFSNGTHETLEGDFSLALPDDAVVTGYALDVDGQMIDGVLMEPQHARAQYEKQLRKRVDPGVAEVSRANVFRTRVFPINEDTGRTIRVTFVAPIHATTGWVLPLSLKQRVPSVDIRLRAEGVARAPVLTLPLSPEAEWPSEAEWRNEDGKFVAQAKATRVPLSGELRLAPVTLSDKVIASAHPNGGRFFQLSDDVPVSEAARPAPKRLRLYWDRSRSRQDDALDREIAFITRYLAVTKPAAIDVVLFNSSGVRVETFTNADAVRDLLKGVTYRGATSFQVLASASAPPASLCLLVSDGLATIDARDRFEPDCELFAITSAPDADTGYLAVITRRASSEVLRLDRSSVHDELIARLTRSSPAILDVRDANGAPVSYTMLPSRRGHILATGEAPASGEIVVRMGGSGAQPTERRYSMSNSTIAFDGAGALWAADRVRRLAAVDDHEKMTAVSRRFGVAGPSMSFIVFETPEQYVEAKVAPPRRFPKAWRAQYASYKAEWDQARQEARDERLEEVIAAWEFQKQWWATAFDPNAKPVKRALDESDVAPPAAAPAPGEIAVTATASRRSASELEEIQVTGALRVSGPRIELEPWNVKRPYIVALKAAPPDQIARVLAEQEQKHGALPAFYLDVAEWFKQRGQVAEAIELALTALELPSRNDETLSVVADRMLRYGQIDRAIWLNEQLVKLEPDRPQPLRALALALAKRAAGASGASAAKDLERAVTLLKDVILTPWEDDYDGVELIALMEANQLLPKLRKLGVKKPILDPALVAPLDVDVRVVIEWNTAATDIDLWVDEPSGERAMYNNPTTAIGGRLSNDMTSGFGPEEYLLRRAPAGDFEIKVNVFNVDSINPNGATVVTARVIHDFGRPTQREELRDLELAPDVDSSNGVLLGKVRFAPISPSTPSPSTSPPVAVQPAARGTVSRAPR